ncbi:MAG: hypothetical protein IT371_22845 [Deltaproteobacteria bacterium]|nr:hypothetical protein [Deltaproteobacteria bacterium]
MTRRFVLAAACLALLPQVARGADFKAQPHNEVIAAIVADLRAAGLNARTTDVRLTSGGLPSFWYTEASNGSVTWSASVDGAVVSGRVEVTAHGLHATGGKVTATTSITSFNERARQLLAAHRDSTSRVAITQAAAEQAYRAQVASGLGLQGLRFIPEALQVKVEGYSVEPDGAIQHRFSTVNRPPGLFGLFRRVRTAGAVRVSPGGTPEYAVTWGRRR